MGQGFWENPWLGKGMRLNLRQRLLRQTGGGCLIRHDG
jgi:hypothetical protein